MHPECEFDLFDPEPIAGVIFEFNKQTPPPKIRGSQFVKREQKVFPKLIIRPTFIPKERPQAPKPPGPK
jgi:hypothetical protein